MSSILAAIDLGPTSTHVINQAIDLAKAYGQEVVVVYANEIPRGERAQHAVSNDKREGMARELTSNNAKLDRLVTRVREAGILKKLVQGRDEPEDLICKAIGEYEPSYAVLGAKQPSALHHMVIGSVPAEIMRRTHVPVVFVQEPQPVD